MLKKVESKFQIIQNINMERLIYISVFIIFAGFIINGCLLNISNHISSALYNFVDKALFIIEGATIGITLLFILIKKPKKILCLYGIFAGIFLLYYLLFPQNREAMILNIKDFFLYDVTIFVLFLEVSQDKKLFSNIVKIAKIIFGFSVLYLILLLWNQESFYNVWLAKHFFIVAIFTLYDYYKYKSKSSFFISIFCLGALLATGSRTYLLCYCIFILILLLSLVIRKIKTISKKKKIIVIVLMLVIAIILIILFANYKVICDKLYDFFAQNGIEIRILRLLATDNFFTSNNRTDIIYPTILNAIKENWMFGTGICGDRVIIHQQFQNMGMLKPDYNYNSYYSHNLILELYVSFGVILASIIIGFIVYGFYKVIKNKYKNSNAVICLFFVGVLPLMLNSTFLENTYFWAFIALLCANLWKNNKEEQSNTKSKNVVMLLDNAFEPDIRVYKEAKYLVDNHINVEIVCLDKKNKYKDKEFENYNGINIKRMFCRTEHTTKLIEKYVLIRKLKQIIYFWWLLKFIFKVKKYLKNKEFQILHCHDLLMAFIGCIFFRDKEIVFDMHEYYGNSKSKLSNFIIRKMVSYTQNRANWIIYVNEFQKKGCKNKNLEKFVEIPNYPERKNFQNINKIPSDQLRISYIGKVRDFSSLSKLIDCNINDNLIKIAIYGDGSEFDKLLEFAKKKGKEWIMKGHYDGVEDTERIYNNTDILYAVYDINCNNSLNWKNAMPIKSYEAIITLTPMIANKDTALGSFIEENNIGFTIDITKEKELEELLEKIMSNPVLLEEKIENMKKIQYMYTWDNIIKNINKIYLS